MGNIDFGRIATIPNLRRAAGGGRCVRGRALAAIANLLAMVAVLGASAAPDPATAASTSSAVKPRPREFSDGAGAPAMVIVPAGEFLMGSPVEERRREGVPDRVGSSEEPVHKVTIARPFAVSKYPITRAQYALFVKETNRPDPPFTWSLVEKLAPGTIEGHVWAREAVKTNNWRSPGYPQATDRHPVVALSWDDARAYAAWLAKRTGKPYRLLSEAEWEYAARAGTRTTRFWGDDRDGARRYAKVPDLTYADYFGFSKDPTRVFQIRSGFPTTAPVGSFKPNPFGLYDMLGNAGAWTEDVWHDIYEGAPADGSAWLAGGDPQRRVMRNGHWNGFPWMVRSAGRVGLPAAENLAMVGLRVAVAVE